MARRCETQMSKPREMEVCVALTCDLCGRSAPRPDDRGEYGSSAWTEGSYDVERVLVSYESGSNFPEGHYTETQSQGATPTVRESDG
jgi:hypothetical protein